jgi:putative transposase
MAPVRDGGPSPSRQRRAELDAKVADFHQASDGVGGDHGSAP